MLAELLIKGLAKKLEKNKKLHELQLQDASAISPKECHLHY